MGTSWLGSGLWLPARVGVGRLAGVVESLLIGAGILLGCIGRGRGEWRAMALGLEAFSRDNEKLDVVSVAK